MSILCFDRSYKEAMWRMSTGFGMSMKLFLQGYFTCTEVPGDLHAGFAARKSRVGLG
jgi:hypothetical protein